MGGSVPDRRRRRRSEGKMQSLGAKIVGAERQSGHGKRLLAEPEGEPEKLRTSGGSLFFFSFGERDGFLFFFDLVPVEEPDLRPPQAADGRRRQIRGRWASTPLQVV
ncbi:Uncharacterized protein M6B38_240065 [Iris pallida]|uniref:Uncharacterized protein n=1 Tax=Iris pallida TaxID=29817 RepID=A0AAX6DKC7_IRIPA|nr:Uncharacterized protein M6B38_240065 [Iris pallida]